MLAKFEALKARPEQIARLRGKAEPEPERRGIEVEPELWDAFRVFRLVFRTQWRWETVVAGKKVFTTRHGLDYTAVRGVARDIGAAATEMFWEQIGAMELTALGIYRAREKTAIGRL